jgi:hypothetical protein
MSGDQALALEVAVDVLKKRQEWLAKRIAMASAAGRALTHDELEVIAIQTIAEHITSTTKEPS